MRTNSARLRDYCRAIALIIAAGVGASGTSVLGQSSPSFRVAQTPQTPQFPSSVPSGEPSTPADATATPTPPEQPPVPANNYAELFSPATAGLSPSSAIAPANSTLGSAGAYIDSAIPRSLFRVRYDVAGGVNHPERAEFFWPQFGPGFARQFSYQELDNYLEYAPTANFSAFIDAPIRFLHLPQNGAPTRNLDGFSDLTLGAKYAFVARPDAFYTFQLKAYTPTGNSSRGLGTGHPSLEPGLLAFRQVSERFFLVGQLSDWIPVGGPNFAPPGQTNTPGFAGNILNYGLGGFFNAVQTDHFRFAPTVEFVGWTVLSGRVGTGEGGGGSPAGGNNSTSAAASGQTIVNAKVGARFGLGDYFKSGGATPLNDRASLYVGYGRSLTGDVWYKDLFRLELTIFF